LTAAPWHKTFSVTEQVHIRQSAWHARKLGRLASVDIRVNQNDLEVGSEETATEASEASTLNPDRLAAFLSATKMTPTVQAQRRQEAAAVLLLSAVFNRSEGEIEQAGKMVRDAIRWLPATAALGGWHAFAASQLWTTYFMSLDAEDRESLQSFAQSWEVVTKEPRWQIYQRFMDLLKARFKDDGEGPSVQQGEPDLSNIGSLTAVLRTIRLAHGFVGDGLSDESITIPEPLPAEEILWGEFELWVLRVSAFISRKNLPELEGALSKMRQRLPESDQGDAMQIQVYRLYYLARYFHLLLEHWKTQSEEIRSEIPAHNREEAYDALDSWLLKQCMSLPASWRPVREHIFEQAKAAYQRVLQISSLLKFRGLLLECGFHLGRFLLEFTSEDAKVVNFSWWKESENFFEACLKIEEDSELHLHTPEIHRHRWHFFGEKDISASIPDAYNTLQAIRKAGYPDKVVLQWHATVGTILNNYSHTREDYLRSAELHIMWAQTLATLPEAASQRWFKTSLGLEQAKAYNFAAQALRKAGDLQRAEELLAEGERLFQDTRAAEHGEDPTEVRDLGIGIRMQRAWLVGRKPGHPDVGRQLMREIWKDLEPGCQHNANVLGCIIDIEDGEKTLGDPWPSSADSPALADRDNPQFSLPEEWFQGQNPLRVRNRFDYRLRQLLKLVSDDLRPNVLSLELLGTYSEWNGQEHFGETVLSVATIEANKCYLGNHKELLLTMLESLALWFHDKCYIEKEIEAYRLLTQFRSTEDRFRLAYGDALLRHEEFVQRELRVRAVENSDWLGVAERLTYYFSVLVDETLAETKMAEKVGRSRRSAEDFERFVAGLKTSLPRARKHFRRKEYSESQFELEDLISLPSPNWVLLQELEAVDLWLRSTAALGQADTSKFNQHAALLRERTLQYVAQFPLTIPELQIQQLAVQFLDTLRKAQPIQQDHSVVAA